jgi:hypothetical protein
MATKIAKPAKNYPRLAVVLGGLAILVAAREVIAADAPAAARSGCSGGCAQASGTHAAAETGPADRSRDLALA